MDQQLSTAQVAEQRQHQEQLQAAEKAAAYHAQAVESGMCIENVSHKPDI
jgi:hypothetical protein